LTAAGGQLAANLVKTAADLARRKLLTSEVEKKKTPEVEPDPIGQAAVVQTKRLGCGAELVPIGEEPAQMSLDLVGQGQGLAQALAVEPCQPVQGLIGLFPSGPWPGAALGADG